MIKKFPRLPEEHDKRKKLTVRKMVLSLMDFGLSYRQMADIFGVNYTLFGKYKIPLEEAAKQRDKYDKGCGNTAEYRQRKKEVHKDDILAYARAWRKGKRDEVRKNKFTPRLNTRKYPH